MNASGGWMARLCQPALFGPLLLALALAQSAWLMDRGSPPNDEGALLTNAAKLLRGGVYYRDVDSYPFPGAAGLLALAMALFGERIATARALAAAVYCGVIASLYAASLRLLDRPRAALFGLSLLCFKFLAWPAFTAYTYSDLAFLWTGLGFALLLARGGAGSRLALGASGACAGLAVLCKQNLGLYLGAASGLALLLAPRRGPAERSSRKQGREAAAQRGAAERSSKNLPDLLAYGAGAALPLLPTLAYFASHGLLAQLAWSGLVRPFTGYWPTSRIPFGTPLAWWNWGELRGLPAFPYFVSPYWVMLMRGELPGAPGLWWSVGELFSRLAYSAIPLVFALALLRCVRILRRGAPSPAEWRFLALAAVSAAALASAFPRADFFHLASVYPLALLLAFALPGARGTGRVAALAAAVALSLAASSAGLWRYQAGLSARIELPQARLRVAPGDAWIDSVARYASQGVPGGERIFVYGNEAYYYFLSQRFDSWPFSQLYPGQAGGDGGRALVESLRRDPPRLVIRGLLHWPGLPPLPSYTPALYDYLRRHYRVVPDVFERYPPPGGDVPLASFVAVLRRAEERALRAESERAPP